MKLMRRVCVFDLCALTVQVGVGKLECVRERMHIRLTVYVSKHYRFVVMLRGYESSSPSTAATTTIAKYRVFTKKIAI